mmetsp:Transcript_22552/g.55593  ORF Transcript_22552/g.55593 Transcript_22552/m.55593 type:complete len:355 (+) Transcript_22552:235-1299(+)
MLKAKSFRHLFKKSKKSNKKGTLRFLAQKKKIYVGAAINQWNLKKAQYMNTVAREFSMIVAENECKMNNIVTPKKQYNYGTCDRILNVAKKNGQEMRFHALVWYRAAPKVLQAESKAKVAASLKKFCTTVTKRYVAKGVRWFDVVNEAFADKQPKNSINKPSWRKAWPYTKLPNWAEVSLRAAAKGAGKKRKQTRLMYNDYGIESMKGYMKGKSDAVFWMAKTFKKRKIPLDGIGFQTHINMNFKDFDGVRKNIQRLGKLGYEVQFTEVDVSCGFFNPAGKWIKCKKWTKVQQNMQANIYKTLMRICLQSPNCTAFVMWGVTDSVTWLNNDHPHIFDRKYKKKPAYHALTAALK